MARREDESDERRREEHLDDGDITVIAAEDAREWVCVVDSEALCGACQTRVSVGQPSIRKLRLAYQQQDSYGPG